MKYSNADAMFFDMLRAATEGSLTAPRGMATREVLGWTGTLTNPRARRIGNPVRNVRKGYPAASVAWNLGMNNDVDSICWWNPNGRRISDDGITFYGANYGQRWDGYLEEAIHLLEQDKFTRRAWVPIWAPTDLVDNQAEILYSREGKDVPCTLGFGLRVFDGDVQGVVAPRLDMQVVMRSQAAWGVFPYDVYLFSVLQELIANTMGIRLGNLHWSANSLHVYDREDGMVEKAIHWYKDHDRGFGIDDIPAAPVMDPIRFTYQEARKALPYMETLVRNGVFSPELKDLDPLVHEMVEGAAELNLAYSA